MGQKEMAMTGKNRIMIYGPKNWRHVHRRVSVSLEPSTLPPPDCANNALFRSMWRHCDGRRYADRPL